jgi:hypothetical protein
VEAIKVLVEAELEAQAHHGFRPLHAAAIQGQADAARLLAELGADVQPQSFHGTPPEISIERGHRQAEQVLRQLERARKAKQDTPREPAASQDTPQAREAADRMAAAILEEEEREQEAAAQSKAKGKGKAKAGKGGKGGGGGGPSGKAGAGAAAAGSSGQASLSQGGSRPSEPGSSGLRTTQEATLPVAEAASGTQLLDPQPQPASGKKDKERQRKERQRQRKMDEAKKALQGAIEAMLDARCVSPLWLCAVHWSGDPSRS